MDIKEITLLCLDVAARMKVLNETLPLMESEPFLGPELKGTLNGLSEALNQKFAILKSLPREDVEVHLSVFRPHSNIGTTMAEISNILKRADNVLARRPQEPSPADPNMVLPIGECSFLERVGLWFQGARLVELETKQILTAVGIFEDWCRANDSLFEQLRKRGIHWKYVVAPARINGPRTVLVFAQTDGVKNQRHILYKASVDIEINMVASTAYWGFPAGVKSAGSN
jgi:hypothetical protein